MDTYKNKRVVGVFESGNRKELSKEITRLLETGYSKEDITIYANSITMEAFGMSKGINVQHRTKREEDEDTDKSFWERIKGTFTVEEPNYDDESSILNPFKASLEPYLKVLEEGGVLLTVTSDTPPSTDSGEDSSQVDDVYAQQQNRNVQTPSSPLDESWNHQPIGGIEANNPILGSNIEGATIPGGQRDTDRRIKMSDKDQKNELEEVPHQPHRRTPLNTLNQNNMENQIGGISMTERKNNPADDLDTTGRTIDHKGVRDYLDEDNEAMTRNPDHNTEPMETDTVRDTHAPNRATTENPANHLDTTGRTVDHEGVREYLDEENETITRNPDHSTNPMETDTVRDTHTQQRASKETPANHLDTTGRTVDHKGVGDYLNEDNEAENRDPDDIKPK